tara:strand:- start:1129 stop:1653 length:525 start_codon:yes stop_codon:yes gene_type:complete
MVEEFKENISFYIDNFNIELQLFKKGVEIKQRGYLTKTEFLNICLWKSRRPKKWYIQNTEAEIERLTKLAFGEKDELLKLKHLTSLKGVLIPTASAILSITNPKDYPIIDVRCVNSLKFLNIIEWETINNKNWLTYLEIIRKMSFELNLSCREVEKGLFAYNRMYLDKEYKNLY